MYTWVRTAKNTTAAIMSLAGNGKVINESIKIVIVICKALICINNCTCFVYKRTTYCKVKARSSHHDMEVVSPRRIGGWSQGANGVRRGLVCVGRRKQAARNLEGLLKAY